MYISYKSGISNKFIITGIIALGLILRILYADSMPISALSLSLSVGDFSGAYWAEHSVEEEDIGIKFSGYSILYLISENQSRYGFIVCWIFILMGTLGIDLIQKIGTVERERLWKK